ncbi:MAG: UPF0280 family protein [Oceanibaculum nanhaiense]|uniref:UPF0280 family protein n=1 Tax=Oceanibaculum nanhaiense TaxID=1909734 RepID=UPI0025A339CD|nr:UPF0280 family protein [Oceanibaculum nanhaiense]MDM7945166.1 UPF0280 family protein [Oceanibaculum nanhaiense]
MSIQRAFLPDGRLHLQHGPIDLVIEAFGPLAEVRRAYWQAVQAFDGLLEALTLELHLLRRPLGGAPPTLYGPVAKRMLAAVWPHRDIHLTPMAAVAGSVADHVLAALLKDRRLTKAYVNDGGDIAFHLTGGESFRAGLVPDLTQATMEGLAEIPFESPVRGIATSGSGGRSLSLGIADAVTVLAADAAAADAAATLIANAVDLPNHSAISRVPASSLDPDSDLGELPVTLDVGPLGDGEIGAALAAGLQCAHAMREAGHIHAAVLSLRGRFAMCGTALSPELTETR